MADPLAVVIGDCDLVRPLGKAGINVVTAPNTLPENRWSRHTVGSFDLPDLWREPERTVQALNQWAQSQPARPVLFYQTDSAVRLVSRYRSELAAEFDFVISEESLVEDLVDKARFAKRAEQLGLATPRTAIATCGSGADRPDFDHWAYPVIVKPAVRDRGRDWSPIAGAAKAQRCPAEVDLVELLEKPSLAGMDVLVQEEVVGDEAQIWSYHAFVDPEGMTRAELTGRKIRTWPIEFGLSTSVEIVGEESVREAGRELLAALGFTGVVKVDFKRDPSGELIVLEVNPRFSLWHSPAALAGVNIPDLVYRYLVDGAGSVDATLVDAVDGVRWCHPANDYRAAMAQGMSRVRWLRFFQSTKARHAIHYDDPGAIVGVVANQLAA